MIILISPSKTLDIESPATTETYTVPDFLADSKQLIQRLKKIKKPALGKLMKISDKLVDLNFQRYQDWTTPFSPKNAKQAIYMFKGDVYTGLNIDEFGIRDTKNCQKQLRILSGLYGLLRPLDLIQPYRLEMGTRLETDRGGNLYEFWGDRIVNAINQELKLQKSEWVINLASNEYFKAARQKQINGNVVSPAFKEYRNGDYKMIGLFAKKARGLMSRFIIRNRISKIEDLKDFDYEGYQFNNKLTVDGVWAFTRKR